MRGQTSGTTTQGENDWLDLEPYQHVVAWLHVVGLTTGGGTVQIAYQTSVRRDDDLFVNMSGPNVAMPFTPAMGVTVTTLYKNLLRVPIARWFRWQLTATGTSSTWDIEFLLHVSASGATRQHKPAIPPMAR
jgi:hypothetical protein